MCINNLSVRPRAPGHAGYEEIHAFRQHPSYSWDTEGALRPQRTGLDRQPRPRQNRPRQLIGLDFDLK